MLDYGVFHYVCSIRLQRGPILVSQEYISALSFVVGVTVSVWPYALFDTRASPYTAAFWECGDCSDTVKGIRIGVSIFLSTGYCVGSVVAILLNALLPVVANGSYESILDKDNADESQKVA